MINVKISGDGTGKDICDIDIEYEYSDEPVLRLMAQLKEVNSAVLDAMVNHGFSPKEMSDIMCFVLFNTVTDFRNKYNIKVN